MIKMSNRTMTYNKMMINKKIWSVFLLFLMMGSYASAQETSEVKVLSNAQPSKIMLRWAVNTPLGWKKGNEYGFIIERYTISRNGNSVIPVESVSLTSIPLKPRPLQEWEGIVNEDENAAVIAQAIYGDDFNVDAGGGTGGMGAILAVNEELEQRFTFALMASEQSFEGAKYAGWAYEDTSVIQGEKYLYKIRVALPLENELTINEGSVYASTEFYKELPKPVGFVSIFADSNVMLSWNFNLLQSTYTRYQVEKSTDGVNFKKVNGQPVFNAEETEEGKQISLFYNDSIANNKTYYYRIKGMTPFGETGPPSDVEKGAGLDILDYTPHITRKILPTDETLELYWEFAKEGNELINGFELRRAPKAEGPYEVVIKNIPPTARKINYSGLRRVNYFSIVAIGKNNTEKPSFPALVQPVDSIPPKPPVQLEGIVDTTGLVKLSWAANTEADISGYRVFRSNNPDQEFSQITGAPNRKNSYTDTIPVKNLNKNIYYKLIAVDQRYNESSFSEVLTIEKPDLTPPSPAVIKTYEIMENGIKINWIPSSSDDVISHSIYRKELGSEENLWEKISEVNIEENITVYLDEAVVLGRQYAYTIVANDKTGWESEPSQQLVVKVPKKMFAESIVRFNGLADRENRLIRLSWKAEKANVSEYLLYRAVGDAPLSLYKTIAPEKTNYTDVSLTINTKYSYGLQLVEKDGTQSQIKKINVTY